MSSGKSSGVTSEQSAGEARAQKAHAGESRDQEAQADEAPVDAVQVGELKAGDPEQGPPREATVALADRYAAGERTVGRLPGGGVARLEPDLPMLFVYRNPGTDDPGTARLLGGEASVLLAAPGSLDARYLVRRVAAEGAGRFGAFLVLEVWAGRSRERFVIRAPVNEGSSTALALEEALESVFPEHQVVVERGSQRATPGMDPLLSIAESHERGTLILGLGVPPTYRSLDGRETYPVHLRAMRGLLSVALRRAAFDFVRVQTSAEGPGYRALGPRVIDDRAAAADRDLADIEQDFSLLLLVAPVNQDDEWERFQSADHQRDPEFHYRLLPFDPDLLKRRLFEVPLEHVDDPAMSFLLRDKREELDRQISLLAERNTPAFRLGSIRLYGTVDDRLVARAEDLLRAIAESPDEDFDGSPTTVDSHAFAARAHEEFDYYRKASPAFGSSVQVRSDLAGLMVSSGQLLIGEGLRLTPRRVEPLIHHEVGTHVLTWCNGAAQPIEQLRNGLAGYDELQEGLAVFSEYLVGGLDAARMRVLGARVVAAASVQSGASFVDTFRILHREYGFSPIGAFGITARVHACGGFTRDAIYLRGLVSLLNYLERGGDLEPLFIGKLALRHVSVLSELRERGILSAPPLRPRYLDLPGAARRLEAARGRLSLFDLIG